MTQESSLSAAVEDRPGASDPSGRVAQIAHLEGQIEVLRGQLASLEAADEHHRGEFAAARAEATEAQATLRETQARLAERQQTIDDLRHRLEAAEASQSRAEQERTAVIEALGRRARRRLSGTD